MFRFCYNLKTISLPKSITKIEQGAFMICLNLESVYAFAELQFIGDLAFASCHKLKTILITPSHNIELHPKVFDAGVKWQDIIKI